MTSYLMKMAASIVTAHLANSREAKGSDIPGLIESIYQKMVELEHNTLERYGVAFEGPQGRGRPAPQGSSALPLEGISHPDRQGLAPQTQRQPAPGPSRLRRFDPEAWLSSLPEPTRHAEREAYSDNPLLENGWVGVHQDFMVCLIDGRKVRGLTRYLASRYRNYPQYSTPETYKAHFNLPFDYPMSAPSHTEQKSAAMKRVMEERREHGKTRSPEIQAKIDQAIARSGLDPERQISPVHRPGNFPYVLVCLECSAKVHNLEAHLKSVHRMSWTRYVREYDISHRFPRTAPDGHSAQETMNIASRAIKALGLNPASQVKPNIWPGVYKNMIICLEDNELVSDLGEHLRLHHQLGMEEYRAKYQLPDDYPETTKALSAKAENPALAAKAEQEPSGKAPAKRGRPARDKDAPAPAAPARTQAKQAPSVKTAKATPERSGKAPSASIDTSKPKSRGKLGLFRK